MVGVLSRKPSWDAHDAVPGQIQSVVYTAFAFRSESTEFSIAEQHAISRRPVSGGRGCAKNPAKRLLLVAVVALKKRILPEALGDGGSATKKQAIVQLVFF